MADGEDLSEVIVPTMEEILIMKVADLRKKLKEFGLPVTGNKTELVERLQTACFSSKEMDSYDSSHLSLDDSQISEHDGDDNNDVLEEDSSLLLYNSSSYISSSQDDSKLLDTSENKLTNSTSVIMPPKKRTITAAASEGVGLEKKVSLIRSNAALKEFSIQPASESKPAVVSSNSKTESEEKKVLTVKNMSAAERLAMRAKRFNVSGSAVAVNTSKSMTNSRNSKQSILSSSVAPDLDVLKKRAERFGQSVSAVMKQIENKEKLLKRKCKFGANLGASATSSLGEQEKKKQRAERFGIS